MSSYYESLDKESQLCYDRKLTTADGKKLPDPMSLKDWKNNVALSSDVNWPDIYNYLVNTPSEYTHESMKAYKSLNAYELFAGMYMMFFTTKLTRTIFALLNQSYFNLLYQTIYQSCIFQGYIVAGHPVIMI